VAEGRVEGAKVAWAIEDVSKVLKGKPFSGEGELSEQQTGLSLNFKVPGGKSGSVALVLDKGK